MSTQQVIECWENGLEPYNQPQLATDHTKTSSTGRKGSKKGILEPHEDHKDP